MRRQDRQVADLADVEAIIAAAEICHLAMIDDQEPYVVPLSFGYRPGRLYFHCAHEGRKLDVLRRNPAVCFSLVGASEVVSGDTPCNGSVHYASVIGHGSARIVEEDQEKSEALAAIVGQYGGDDTFVYPPAALRAVTVIRVDIASMTGKRNAG